ncbi:type II toxin-antitoxin system ParD family antitoxin [Mesorhizobium sp. BH1-1-5]|uniref:type II toxin-antitoxin system ParD family antitoxin n=1 Tax=Mesorhizobium sp. BH1-1-5 TaxID=2876661 RepID=UPI001CCB8A1B|nr:type II toxin-antitoxin system ParD family antitoxin [Mesorhizobium sp. BH1-1-5]MBZ9985524.1 type II toxin-antitoxin system ParD family antitoxin [Mesorhizobium sp. BH1-1-5]
MPASYSIGSRYEAFVRELVESGRYASASEVVRDSLRLLEEREEHRQAKLAALREDIRKGIVRKGIESGPAIAADEVFDRLEKGYAACRTSKRLAITSKLKIRRPPAA